MAHQVWCPTVGHCQSWRVRMIWRRCTCYRTPSQYFSLHSISRKRKEIFDWTDGFEITGTVPNIIVCLLKLFLTLAIVLLFKYQQALLQLSHHLAWVFGGLPEQRHGREWIGLSGIIRIYYVPPTSTGNIFDLCIITSCIWINYIFQL